MSIDMPPNASPKPPITSAKNSVTLNETHGRSVIIKSTRALTPVWRPTVRGIVGGLKFNRVL